MIFTSIPVVIVFSLCYAATRHEDMRSIIRHACHFGFWLFFAMAVVIGAMELMYFFRH